MRQVDTNSTTREVGHQHVNIVVGVVESLDDLPFLRLWQTRSQGKRLETKVLEERNQLPVHRWPLGEDQHVALLPRRVLLAVQGALRDEALAEMASQVLQFGRRYAHKFSYGRTVDVRRHQDRTGSGKLNLQGERGAQSASSSDAGLGNGSIAIAAGPG
jgi:hypothetical protein